MTTKTIMTQIKSTSKELDLAIVTGDRNKAVVLSNKYEKLMDDLRSNLKVQ